MESAKTRRIAVFFPFWEDDPGGYARDKEAGDGGILRRGERTSISGVMVRVTQRTQRSMQVLSSALP